MVIKVTLPKPDSIDVFNNILESRQKYQVFFDAISDDWSEQVELYLKISGDPNCIFPLDLRNYTRNEDEAKLRKNTLINLYSPKKEDDLHSILEQMRRHHGLLVCPSCGDSGAPGTLDHYLPKDVFPELAIVLANLTPMCSDCQQEKGTEYLSVNGFKKYIHPYYDNITFPVIQLEILPPFKTPIFNLSVCSALSDELFDLVSNHIEGLELEVRFRRFCKSKYLHLLKQARKSRTTRCNNLRTVLKIIFEDQEDEKGINCWEAVFYRSVLENDELFDFLENSDLPAYL